MKRIKPRPIYQKDKPPVTKTTEEPSMKIDDLQKAVDSLENYEWGYTQYPTNSTIASASAERYNDYNLRNGLYGMDPIPVPHEIQNNELINVQFIDAIGAPDPLGNPGQNGEPGQKGDSKWVMPKAAKYIDPDLNEILNQELSKTRYNFKPSFGTARPSSLGLEDNVKKVYYPKPDREEDLSDRDHEEEEDNIYRKEQEEYKAFQEQKKIFILNHFTLYRESQNEIYLMKVLLTHFYHILENAWAFNTLKAKYRDYTQKHITSFIKKDMSYFYDNLVRECNIKVTDINDLIPAIEGILDTIYNFKLNPQESKLLFISINNSDCFFEVMNTAKARGVRLDPEFLNLNIDFKELRSRNQLMTIVYVLPFNQLILYSSNERDLSTESKNRSYNTFLNYVNSMYPLLSLKENTSVVVINGKEYSREAFESITESNLDNFLSILEVESLIMAEEVSDVADHPF